MQLDDRVEVGSFAPPRGRGVERAQSTCRCTASAPASRRSRQWATQPADAGIDPYVMLIDLERFDNVKKTRLSAEGGESRTPFGRWTCATTASSLNVVNYVSNPPWSRTQAVLCFDGTLGILVRDLFGWNSKMYFGVGKPRLTDKSTSRRRQHREIANGSLHEKRSSPSSFR